jgi:hypothetical protein
MIKGPIWKRKIYFFPIKYLSNHINKVIFETEPNNN